MARKNSIGIAPAILRPAAAPTDTYVRPNAGKQLEQLAEGLSSLAPSLARFSGALAEQKGSKDKQAGENKARELVEQGKTYADAIKEGLIEPHQSPWFRVGAYETFGRVTGNHYADELEAAFRQSDEAASSNPEAFDSFERTFRASWTKEKLGDKIDPYFENAFGSTAEGRVLSLRSQAVKQAGEKLVSQNLEAFHAEVFQTLQQFRGGDVHAEELAGLIKVAQERQRAVGIGYDQINRLTASAIAAAAKRFEDTSLLDVMDEVRTGSGKLSGTSYGSALREQAENEIAGVRQSRMSAEHIERERQEKQMVEGVTGELVNALNTATNPALVDLKPFIAKVSKIDPGKAETYLGMRDAFTTRVYQDNPEVKSALFLGVHTSAPGTYGYTTQAKVDRALAAKSITPATYSQLSDDITQREKEGGLSKLFNDDGLKALTRRVRSAFVAEFGASTVDQRRRAESAEAEATDRYLRWRKGPGAAADAPAVNEWINREVGEQFNTKGDKLDVESTVNVPDPTFGGPKRPKVDKVPAADPTALYQLRSEFQNVQSGKAKGLSRASISLLRQLGIRADPAEIQAFLDAQAKLGATP